MTTVVDYFPHTIMKDTMLTAQHNRRNSWATSISSSSSSTAATSWFERKLFTHFKRFFRRKSLSLTSNSSSLSSRRPSINIEDSNPCSVDEQPQEEEEEKKVQIVNNERTTSSTSISDPPITTPIDSLYDYDRLLARCIQRQEHDRNEMILRCQTPISIPHADLLISQSGTILLNWKAYIRLFQGLLRDPQLFQHYVNEYYSCQSSVNQREQLIMNIRTTKAKFDNLLRKFLDEYVTCLTCQTAQTHLIKSNGTWRTECQLCGSQRIVKRLKWKHQNQSR